MITLFSFLLTYFYFFFSLEFYHFYSHLLFLIIFFWKIKQSITDFIILVTTVRFIKGRRSRYAWLLLEHLCSFNVRIYPHWMRSSWDWHCVFPICGFTLFWSEGSFELGFWHDRRVTGRNWNGFIMLMVNLCFVLRCASNFRVLITW